MSWIQATTVGLARQVVLALALTAGLAGAPPCLGAAEDSVRGAMVRILGNVRSLLEIASGPRGLENPGQTMPVLVALGELADQAATIARHGEGDTVSLRFLSRSLERYATELQRNYEWRQYRRAESLLYRMTDICIACHTRLPNPGDSPIAEHFMEGTTLAKLTPLQRVRMLAATRRFEATQAAAEEVLSDPATRPDELIEAARALLIVSIRVRENFRRPISAIQGLTERPDAPADLVSAAAEWLNALRGLSERTIAWGELATARDLLREAQYARRRQPRGGLVQYTTAAAVLHRYLDTATRPPTELAEAYYLLGLAEYRASGLHWLPQPELYLELAILTAPKAPTARHAFVLLEEKLSRTFSGSSNRELPTEVADHLAKLKRLIDD